MGIAFDTLKFVEKLESGGFTPSQARVAAEAFANATGEQLATKADLDALAAATKADLGALAAGMKADLAAHAAGTKAALDAHAAGTKAALDAHAAGTKAALDAHAAGTNAALAVLASDLRQTELRLEGKIEATKSDILKWMFGQTLLILGAVIALTRLGH